MLTNVSKTSCAKQCIGSCMCNHICITMTYKNWLSRKCNTAENENTAFDWCICKTMNIKTLSDTYVNHQISPFNIRSA